MAIKIDINGTREEFDIAGDIYTVDMSDDAMQHYITKYNEFVRKADELKENDVNMDSGVALSAEQIEEIKKSNKDAITLIKEVYDLFLGAGAFEKIYSKTGKSTYTLANILTQIMDVIMVKHRASQVEKENKYLGK